MEENPLEEFLKSLRNEPFPLLKLFLTPFAIAEATKKMAEEEKQPKGREKI